MKMFPRKTPYREITPFENHPYKVQKTKKWMPLPKVLSYTALYSHHSPLETPQTNTNYIRSQTGYGKQKGRDH